jgi:hypothetical protein
LQFVLLFAGLEAIYNQKIILQYAESTSPDDYQGRHSWRADNHPKLLSPTDKTCPP